jgi:hypothetical protein
VTRLLVDISALTGFEAPSISERYEMVVQWADAARGAIKLAMLSRPEMIDLQRFDVTVARNRDVRLSLVSGLSQEELIAFVRTDRDSVEASPSDAGSTVPDGTWLAHQPAGRLQSSRRPV